MLFAIEFYGLTLRGQLSPGVLVLHPRGPLHMERVCIQGSAYYICIVGDSSPSCYQYIQVIS